MACVALAEGGGLHSMANYVLTDTPNIDWASVNWDNLKQYAYRNPNDAGKPSAQEEFDRRKAAGTPTVMWRFDDNESPPKEVDRCNV
jgi:hypothetical protein